MNLVSSPIQSQVLQGKIPQIEPPPPISLQHINDANTMQQRLDAAINYEVNIKRCRYDLHLDEQISATFADEQAAKKYKTEAIIFASIAKIGTALPEITAESVANSDLFTRNQATILARLDGIAATLNNHTEILSNHTLALNNHTVALNNHTVALNNHDVLLANLKSNSDATNTRLFNFRATQLISPIQPIMLANGLPPQNFPHTRLLLTNLTPTMVRNLCLDYGLPAEPLNAGGATNRQLLYAHLGIPE